jgi:hypothetical protein
MTADYNSQSKISLPNVPCLWKMLSMDQKTLKIVCTMQKGGKAASSYYMGMHAKGQTIEGIAIYLNIMK